MRRTFDVSLEITPPRVERPGVLLRRARALGEGVRFVNVIERPDRWSSLAAAGCLRRRGFEAVWHLANRGRREGEIEAWIERARRADLRRVLCIRGEYEAKDAADTPKIREVVRMLRRRLPRAVIAVTLDPHRPHPRVLRALLPKLEAGAGAVQTQVTFDLESLRSLAELLRQLHPHVEIRPMLCPLLSPRAALRLSRRIGVPVPVGLVHRLEVVGEDAGWEHFAALAAAVRRSPLYDGIAVMAPMDVSPRYRERLQRVLAPCGPVPPAS